MKTRICLFIYLCLSFLFISCEKAEIVKQSLSENFIGKYRVIHKFTNKESERISTISAGIGHEMITWNIDGFTFELEINEMNPNKAKHTNFSVPILLNLSSSITRINQDTLEASYRKGTVLSEGYRSEHYYLVK